ncbi:MAG: dolichol kinase [Desulfurococcaceae archaeon]
MALDLSAGALATDSLMALPLFAFIVFLVGYATRSLYGLMRRVGLRHNVAVYYNRKLIHMGAGGLAALVVAYYFREPLVPLAFALALALMTYAPHRLGKLMYWFQVEDNSYEVNFCLAWGISVFALWLLTGNQRISVVPALFISFGDAVTGLVRNALFGRRTKHWIGNVAMAAVAIPVGLHFAGLPGAVAGAISSAIELLEAKPVDDNVLIAAASSVVLAIWRT